jgi:hypothetical protein
MVEYRTRTKRYLELWFDEPEPRAGRYDVVVRHRAPQPGPRDASQPFHSLQIDLGQSADEIFRGFTQNARSQIRGSLKRDELRFEFDARPGPALRQEFEQAYDALARAKGLPALPALRLAAYFDSQCTVLGRVADAQRTLVWHVYVTSGSSVTLMYSVSLYRDGDDEFRKLVGRANRRLHWEELQHFQREGFRLFDFGGWYEGSEDEQRLAINLFKEQFGGKKVVLFDVIENRSLVAKAIEAVKRLRGAAAMIALQVAGVPLWCAALAAGA